MIICPHCRSANDEERLHCSNCGQSLEPGPSALRPRRKEDERIIEEIEVPPHRPRRAWPVLIVLGVAVVAAGVYFLYSALKPDPCRGKAVSERYDAAYCVALPEGWKQQPAMIGDQVSVDEFYDPAGVATVHVVAFDLPDGTTVDEFAQATREADVDAEFEPGPVKETELGGVDARTWDIRKENQVGDVFHLREVVAVTGGAVGWTVEISDTADGFEANAATFEEMLSSWHFD